MQTFLPYSSFHQTAKCLDNRRLGKQRVETLQLLHARENALNGIKSGWQKHPACQMWIGSEAYLAMYGIYICEEWIRRGYKDTCLMKIENYLDKFIKYDKYPFWIKNERFHSSHRASLLAKNFQYYSQFGWTEEPKIDYFWSST